MKLSIFIISIPTPDFPHFYYMLGGNLGSLLYGDVSVICSDCTFRKVNIFSVREISSTVGGNVAKHHAGIPIIIMKGHNNAGGVELSFFHTYFEIDFFLSCCFI